MLGYNVEYSSISFALFFIGEYANIILMSTLCVIFFLGGWLPPINILAWFFEFILTFFPQWFENYYFLSRNGPLFELSLLWEQIPAFWIALKINFMIFIFLWGRAAFPRYRYDQLMRLGWKIFLPVALFYVFFTSLILFLIDGLPTQW